MELLERFEHRPISLLKKPFGDVDSIVRVYPNKVAIERGVVDFGKRQAVRHDRLTEPLVFVRDDVGSIDKERLWQTGKCATATVSLDDRLPEGGLMQPLFDFAKRVSPFD